MSYQVITDFRQGLDARKYKLALPPGTLLRGNNGHITQGGEFEKRKAFVPMSIPADYAGIHFGLQPATGGIYLFGSKTFPRAETANRQRTANVASLFVTTRGTRMLTTGDVVNISGIGGAGYNGNGITLLSATNSGHGPGFSTQTITYASVAGNEGVTVDVGGIIVLRVSTQLPAPLLYEALTNPGADEPGVSPDMTAVVSSTVFSGQPFVIAAYSDGTVFPFYGAPSTITLLRSGVVQHDAQGALLDSYVGLQLAAFVAVDVNSGQNLLKLLALDINNNQASYTTNYIAGAMTFDLFSVPTTLNGTPYTVATSLNTAAGTLVAAQQTSGTAATAAAQAVGSFQIIAAGTGTQATGTITNQSDAQPNDGDTLTIGATVYRFKNAMAQAYDVKIQGTRAGTFASFAAAINATGVAGTDYFAGTAAHPMVRCTALNNTSAHYTLSIAAIVGGTAGNALAFSSTGSTRLVVSAATLAGAVDSKINQIVVNGATNLLGAAVSFTTDETTTAAAVATAINALPASGYQAISSGSSVTILAQVAGTAPNGRTIQVQAQGTIVCGSGAFSLTGSGFTLDFCKANGVDLMSDSILLANEAVMTYPQVTGQVLADFCRAVANNLNAGTGTHGYLAHCAQGSVSIYLCKATTTSGDKQQVLDVSVTASGGQSGSAIPVTVTPLSVSLDSNAVAIGVGGKSQAVTATVAGGVAPFTYRWTQQGSNVIGAKANSAKAAQTTFSSTALSPTLKSQLQIYNRLQTAAQKAAYLEHHTALQAYLAATTTNQVTFICTVSDSLGQQADSDPVYITLLGQTQ